jgi:hypothetical protein
MASEYAESVGQRYGLPVGFMATMGWLESKHDPKAEFCSRKNGKRVCYKKAAKGWYQYTLDTAKNRGGTNLGRFNPQWSATQAAKDAKKRMRILAKQTGRTVSNKNGNVVWLYLAHNQGDCGLGLIVQMAIKGKVDKWCTSKRKMFRNIYQNTYRYEKRVIRRQGTFNQVAAKAYLRSMKETWRRKAEIAKRYM